MKARVVQDKDKPEVPAEVLAQSIETIAIGFRKLSATRLNRRGLMLLIKDASGVGMSEIELVLSAVENLDKRYLKKITP